MKTIRNTKRRIETRPAPKTPETADLGALKESLLRERLEAATTPALKAQYRWAADEAAALAFVTPWPSFFFPALFAEKADAAREQVARQERIRGRIPRPGALTEGVGA
ncbi:MAG: hypothetical protein HYR88_10600 [Verrucomicrobia bacterium]|nr:hypothetical protein [Verrucomicrobiota bacterium]MBI3869896.1 hypothetical protein [Verrucomicrobiota bacterium]